MHGSVSSNILVVRNIWLGSVLEEDLYYGTVLGLHSVLNNKRLRSPENTNITAKKLTFIELLVEYAIEFVTIVL